MSSLLTSHPIFISFFFFFNDTATTEIYTLSLTTLFRSDPGVAKEVVPHGGRGLQLVQELQSSRSEEHTSELQSHSDLVCRLLLEKKKKKNSSRTTTRALEVSWEPTSGATPSTLETQGGR